MTKSSIARPAAACGFVALALLVTACGSSKTSAAPTTTSTTTAATKALAAFRSCMQSHGVTLPANFRAGGFGGFGGRGGAGGAGNTTGTTRPRPTTTLPAGVTSAEYSAAIAACRSTLPTGAGGLANNPQFTDYYNCVQSYLMANNEQTLPAMNAGGAAALFGGAGFGGFRGGTTSSTAEPTTTTLPNPSLAAAEAHCVALKPAFGAGRTTTTTAAA